MLDGTFSHITDYIIEADLVTGYSTIPLDFLRLFVFVPVKTICMIIFLGGCK